MRKAKIQVEDLACPSCIAKIESAVSKVDGVDKETLNIGFNSSIVKFEFDETKLDIKDVENAITKIGYEVKSSKVK